MFFSLVFIAYAELHLVVCCDKEEEEERDNLPTESKIQTKHHCLSLILDKTE